MLRKTGRDNYTIHSLLQQCVERQLVVEGEQLIRESFLRRKTLRENREPTFSSPVQKTGQRRKLQPNPDSPLPPCCGRCCRWCRCRCRCWCWRQAAAAAAAAAAALAATTTAAAAAKPTIERAQKEEEEVAPPQTCVRRREKREKKERTQEKTAAIAAMAALAASTRRRTTFFPTFCMQRPSQQHQLVLHPATAQISAKDSSKSGLPRANQAYL